METPGHLYTANDLHHLIKESQRHERGWNPTKLVPRYWCQRSLAPIGLVAKEIINRPNRQIVGYRRTVYGDELGTALAGHLLHFSEKYIHQNISLYNLFGATHSAQASTLVGENVLFKNRSPLTRYRIYYELTTANGPVQEVDIRKSLMERYPDDYKSFANSGNVSPHLVELGKSGIIQYKKRGVEDSKSPIRTDRRRSEVSLSTPQRETLTDLTNMLERFMELKMPFIKEGQELAREVISDPPRVAALMRRASEESPQANKTSVADTMAHILEFVGSHPNCTVRSIQLDLKEVYGQKLSDKSIRDVLNAGASSGILTSTKTGDEKRYIRTRETSKKETIIFGIEQS